MEHAIILSTRVLPGGSPVGACPVGKGTLLEYQIATLRQYGVTDISVITEEPVPEGTDVKAIAPQPPLSRHISNFLELKWESRLLVADGACLFVGPHLGHILKYPIQAFVTSKQAVTHHEPGLRMLTGSCGRIRDAGRTDDMPFPWELWSGLLRLNPRACKALHTLLGHMNYPQMDLDGILEIFTKSFPVYAYHFEEGWARIEKPEDIPPAQAMAGRWDPFSL